MKYFNLSTEKDGEKETLIVNVSHISNIYVCNDRFKLFSPFERVFSYDDDVLLFKVNLITTNCSALYNIIDELFRAHRINSVMILLNER